MSYAHYVLFIIERKVAPVKNVNCETTRTRGTTWKMASDIWRRHGVKGVYRQFQCAERLQLLRPIVFIWWLSTILLCTNAASQVRIATGPSPDFSTHSIVRPQIYHARSKREIVDTKINSFDHADVLTIGLEIDRIKRTLDLWLNTDLIPVGYKQRRQYKGNYTTEIPQRVEICHYQGSIRGIPDSWAALSTCQGLRGVVYDGANMHYIHPEEESLDSIHYLYKDIHLISNNTCGYEGTPHITTAPPRGGQSRLKRAADEVIRGPYNANRQSRYVELVLVIDKTEYIALGENLHKVHHHCKDIANIINALYTPLNIFVALVGVEVWTDSDAITLSSKGDTTLANFLRYRKAMLVKEIPNDNAQLLTRIHFEDGVVGKALKGPICTYEFSGGVSMDHSNVIGLVAATVAHEMGHNFGMEHDSADCRCPEDRCIMASSSGSTGPVHWSSCSLEYLALAFEHGMDYCLRNKPKKLFDSPICGNGFVESGEQCDCGLKDNCDNPCCNSLTCMLHPNASCATGECCDLTTCKPKNAGTECRSAEHECDLPEYCTGQSEYCPNDVYKIDGEVCNMGKAFCYQGSCRTHNDQCKLLWGPSGSSSGAPCYEMNNKGSKHGNCGYNRLDSSYIKCDNENILCGMLHCQHLNERLEFGMESVAILTHSFLNHGVKMIACRTAIVDLGLNEVDPGLAPDGAKCAPGKMCVNQKCMPVDSLRASINGGSACLNNCGGNGVCNSLGHCHCNKGFRPPDCLQPGFGGSDDSGPAEDPNARNDFVTALYIIFLGIVPTVALISLAMWYKRNNFPGQTWKKESVSTYVSSIKCFNVKLAGAKSSSIKTSTKSSSFMKNQGLGERIRNSILPKCSHIPRNESSKVFTISDQLLKDKVEITKKSLVSTTNPQVISCSRNIKVEDSSIVADSSKENTQNISSNGDNSEATRVGRKNKDLQKLIMNFEKLKGNTQTDFQQLDESPSCSTSSTFTPIDSAIYQNVTKSLSNVSHNSHSSALGSTFYNNVSQVPDKNQTLKGKLPFYDKKPPPPPVR
uniref:Adam12_0 protein n=1 Tax=Fopius arisanus TaxID=64838 RepID=A0A0C9RIY5_9HYME